MLAQLRAQFLTLPTLLNNPHLLPLRSWRSTSGAGLNLRLVSRYPIWSVGSLRPSRVTRMNDLRTAKIKSHRQNIQRYSRLLATNLTDLELQYLHNCIAEEQVELERWTFQSPQLERELTGPSSILLAPFLAAGPAKNDSGT